MKSLGRLVLTATLSVFSASVWAIPTTVAGNTCGVPDRVGTVTGTSECTYDSNTNFNNAADILGLYSGDAWLSGGELVGGDGTSGGIADGFFSANVTSGTWGAIPANGTYAIDATFWTIYDEAVISMHIGQGGGDPDAWAWLITPDTLAGTWDLSKISGGGGGLSNLKLWGRSQGTVPEPGMVGLLAIGLLSMVIVRRRMKV